VPSVAGYNAPVGQVPKTGLYTNGYFQKPFAHSLGYLNQAFGMPRASSAGTGTPSYPGAPQIPFPALAWNSRPFASPLELLQVPQCSSSQLLSTYYGNPTTGSVWSTFRLVASTASYNPFTAGTATLAFGYLANPFYNSAPGAGTAASPLVRLLDYVEVPSPFVSARNQLDPQTFSNGTTLADLPFAVPFNWISNYRDPGKINLNSINAPQVWQGLTNYFPDASVTTLPTTSLTSTAPNALWGKFVQSRRGYTSTNNSVLDMNSSYPTRFANPFRGTAGAWLVPPVPKPGGSLSSAANNIAQNGLATQIGGEINTGLLRGELNATTGLPGVRPLFQFDSGGTYATTFSGLPSVTIDKPNHPLNPERNPCFRYELIEKLSNTTTTRSNVYAVWITVGYFEARPGPVTQFHPDGYYLGQELGTDTGDIHRHRAFYIFDRSVPMGFVRGLDLNFDKGTLIKRFIE
jgi:hypothetical protein